MNLIKNVTGVLNWHVDISYAVCRYINTHTSNNLSLWTVSISDASLFHDLNTKSSIEFELIGVENMSPHIIWTNYFLKTYDYNVRRDILNQDNKSAILLENHTKYMNHRYFIKDQIKPGELSVNGTANTV